MGIRMIPTIEQIRKLCTESSFERGIEYFHEGSVRGLEQFGNRITSIVKGTSDYEVIIRMDKEDIEASCTCPYDWGGYRIIKEPKELKQIHAIMEKIYEEEKRLNANQRVKKLREESEKFMLERKLNLRRVKPKKLKKIIV